MKKNTKSSNQKKKKTQWNLQGFLNGIVVPVPKTNCYFKFLFIDHPVVKLINKNKIKFTDGRLKYRENT